MAAGPGSAPYNALPEETTIAVHADVDYSFGASVQVNDDDPGDDVLTVRLEVGEGALRLGSRPDGLTIDYSETITRDDVEYARVITLEGAASLINAALTGLTYRAPLYEGEYSDRTRLSIVTGDGVREDRDELHIEITSADVVSHVAPINAVTTDTLDVDFGGTYRFGGASPSGDPIEIADADASPDEDLVVTLRVDFGELVFPYETDDPPFDVFIQYFPSEGSGYWELSGSAAAITDALAGLEYRSSATAYHETETLYIETVDGDDLVDADQIHFNILHTLTPVPADISYEDTPAADEGFLEECGYLDTSVACPKFVLVGGTWIEPDPEELGDGANFVEGESEVEGPVFDQMRVGEYGTLYVDSYSGAYRYVPNGAAINGAKTVETDPFEIEVHDLSGTSTAIEGESLDGFEEETCSPAATAILAITINGVNDLPELAAPPHGAHFMDSPGDDTFPAQGATLTSTDRDAGDDPTYGIVGAVTSTARTGYDRAAQGEYGTLYMDSRTGQYLYQPDDAKFERLKSEVNDTFTLTVTDKSGATATQAYTATIVGRNDRPVAPVAEQVYAATEDRVLAIPAASGALAHATDRDGDPLTAILLSGPSHGVLTLQPDGSFVYRPNADFKGVDSFLVEASDGTLASTPIRVTINVGAEAVAPVAADDVLTVSEDRSSLDARTFGGSVLGNDATGLAGAATALVVTAVGDVASAVGQAVQGRYGTLLLRADGSYTYTLANTDALIRGEAGVERFAYTITNAAGLADTAVLEIRIAGEDLEIARTGAFSAHRGADRIGGGEGADQLSGRAGDDALAGLGGDDLLWGEEGNDTLVSGEGNDQAVGGEGDDVLWLGGGDDAAWGEAGRDQIYGEDGADAADGGADDDRLELGAGDDRGWGGAGADALIGGGGDDRLSGGDDDDAVQGQGGDDRVWGGDGADVLEGGSGSDQFNGGADADRLVLDGGDDTAWGGDGSDVFVAGPGVDIIKDFQDGDRIDLSAFFRSFGALERRMSQDGDHVVIDLPGGASILTVEKVDALDKGDFLF